MNILGIDLGGTNARAGVMMDGHLSKVTAVPLKPNGSESEILAQIEELIEGLADAGLDGIGIGVPSIVDERGIVYEVVNIPSWKQVPVKDLLEQRFKVPVHVNNDANCFAVGEKYFGKGRPFRDIVGMVIGTGLGVGLIINDRLYAGSNCGAGEFGMIPWKEGILEDYCSGKFFKLSDNMSGEELSRKALQGDSHARDLFAEFGRNLGRAIEIVLLAVDPQIIILGGSVSQSFPLFRDAMWKSLGSFPYSQTLGKIRIEVSEVDNVAIRGAAALYLDAMNTGPT